MHKDILMNQFVSISKWIEYTKYILVLSYTDKGNIKILVIFIGIRYVPFLLRNGLSQYLCYISTYSEMYRRTFIYTPSSQQYLQTR